MTFEFRSFPLTIHDRPPEDGEVTAVIYEPFDLTAPPLIRFVAWKCANDVHEIVCVGHHLVFDGRCAANFYSGKLSFVSATNCSQAVMWSHAPYTL